MNFISGVIFRLGKQWSKKTETLRELHASDRTNPPRNRPDEEDQPDHDRQCRIVPQQLDVYVRAIEPLAGLRKASVTGIWQPKLSSGPKHPPRDKQHVEPFAHQAVRHPTWSNHQVDAATKLDCKIHTPLTIDDASRSWALRDHCGRDYAIGMRKRNQPMEI